MKLPFGNTALLLFTRTPQEEVRYKKILDKGSRRSQKLVFGQLTQYARRIGNQTGLPFFVIDSAQQQGQTFGERLHNAVADFFARGFTNVIVIGNDCASLQAADITQAASLLQNTQAVFGPARDGGIYLLGITKALFAQLEGFLQINWQTTTVLAELQHWVRTGTSCTLSQIYADLDSSKDLQIAFYAKELPAIFLQLVTRLFLPLLLVYRSFLYVIKKWFTYYFFFRGPPFAFA